MMMAADVKIYAPTLADLRDALTDLLIEQPELAGRGWIGWDDGCLYSEDDRPHVMIRNQQRRERQP